MKNLILTLAFVSSTVFSSFTSAHNCEEIIISEEHHYLKEPLEWKDLKKIGDALIPGLNKAFICEDTKGESWYVKPATVKGVCNSYLISRLLEKLTEGTELEGMTVDIRLIKGVPEMVVGGKTFIASRTLSNFKTGHQTPSAPVKAKGLEGLLSSILDVYDRHHNNLGYLAFEDKWVPIMIDVDLSDILTFKKPHSCPFRYDIALEMDAETWKYMKHLAALKFEDIEKIIYAAFADIVAVGFKVKSFAKTVSEHLHLMQEIIRVLDQLVSDPCASSASVEKCTKTIASLIKDAEPLYVPGCDQLPQDFRTLSWIAELLMMHDDLDQPGSTCGGDCFEQLDLEPGGDISNFFIAPLFLNYGKIKDNFIKMLESHTPLTNEKEKLYSVNEKTLNLSIERNELVIFKFILKYTDVKSEDLGSALIFAAKLGRIEIVDLLIKAGANLEAKNTMGDTALMRAIGVGHVEIIDLLIKAGADVEAKDTMGDTALIMVARYGYVEMADFLIKAGANLEAKNNMGYTPLILAVENSEIEIVKLLLAANADLHAVNELGYTALRMADVWGSKEIVELLSEAANKF